VDPRRVVSETHAGSPTRSGRDCQTPVTHNSIYVQRSTTVATIATSRFLPQVWRVMDLIDALRCFIRVVETGSFSAVSRESRISQSAVSRQVAQLEEHFRARLFHRSTRRLSLTDDGQSLLADARRLMDVAEEMERALGRQSSWDCPDLGDHAAFARASFALESRSNRCPNPAPSVPL